MVEQGTASALQLCYSMNKELLQTELGVIRAASPPDISAMNSYPIGYNAGLLFPRKLHQCCSWQLFLGSEADSQLIFRLAIVSSYLTFPTDGGVQAFEVSKVTNFCLRKM